MHLCDVISGVTSLLSAVVWIRARCHGWGDCLTNAVNCVNSTAHGIRLLCPSGGQSQSPEVLNSHFRCPRLRYLSCRCKCNGTTGNDDVIDTCRMTSTISSEVTGDWSNRSLLSTITRIILGIDRPPLWPNRIRREVGKSNPSDYFKDYSSNYLIRNSTDYPNNSYPDSTMNLTDYSNNNGTNNSVDFSKYHNSDYSTNAMTLSQATQSQINRTQSNRYTVIDNLTKSTVIKNHDVDERKSVTTDSIAFAQNDVMNDALAFNDAITSNGVFTQNDELLSGSNKTNFQATKGVKGESSHSITPIQNDTVTDGMIVIQSQGKTATALTDGDMTPSDHVIVTTTSDNQVTGIGYMTSRNGTRMKHDVTSNVTADTATTISKDDVTVTSKFIRDVPKKLALAPMIMNSLVENNVTVNDSTVSDSMATVSMVTDSMVTDDFMVTDSTVTDSMATDSMVTDSTVTDSTVTESMAADSMTTDTMVTNSVLTNATVSDIDAEPVAENNYTLMPAAPGNDAPTSDTVATVAMATSRGHGDGEDELVIYYDDCPISGATMAFLAMVLVLVVMVIVLNCYGPRWGHVYRWHYSCRQVPAAGPRVTTTDDDTCPMAHLAKVSDLPVRVEQRAY